MFGVETALWSAAEKRAGKWYRGVLKTAERFTVRWHGDEAELSRLRRVSTVGSVQGNGRRGGNRGSGRKLDQGNAGREGGKKSRRETAVEEGREEMVERVARYKTD